MTSTREGLGGNQPGAVTGHRGLRAEHVHGLRPRGARQQFQRKCGEPALAHGHDTRRCTVGSKLSDHNGAFA
jgi:hypothetical protein